MAVNISIDDDVALVLFELLASGQLKGKFEAPERNALWWLEGAIEKHLVQPFDPNYKQRLAAARASLVDRGGT